MTRNPLLLPICCLAFASVSSAASVSLNISSGYLFGAGGTAVEHRLSAGAVCFLVADLDGNGFDPVAGNTSWVGGADVLVEVSDSEYAGGTFDFDLTSGTVPEDGFLSRTLNIDLAQFGARIDPVPIALRWFPTLSAATTDLLVDSPNFGIPYGEFSRTIPAYVGTSAWVIDLSGGAILDLDPLATPDFGGVDSLESAVASLTVVPEPSSILVALSGFALLLWRRRESVA